MHILPTRPIGTKSMAIIAPYLADWQLPPGELQVFSRIIHAAGDPEYAAVIEIHPQAVQGRYALGNVLASYLRIHFLGNNQAAERFISLEPNGRRSSGNSRQEIPTTTDYR